MKTNATRRPSITVLAACLAAVLLATGPAHGQDTGSAPNPPRSVITNEPPPAPAVDAWRPVGRIEHEPVSECSGIVASRRYPGVFWVHNDSGHPPVLYAVTETGELVAEVPVKDVTNSDWEDIATDDAGHLYVGDVGNNYGFFPIRMIHKIAEPDPYARPVRPARVVETYKYGFDGDRFDAETICVRNGEPLVVPRARAGKTPMYRLAPAEGGKYRPAAAAEIPLGSITGGDISADGGRLAVTTPFALYVYSLDQDGRLVADENPSIVRFPRCGVEACCFDGRDVILASERREIYRVTAAHLAAGTRFRNPPYADRAASSE
ncbi:MAG TPA: hypothetical protein VM243_00525 [Phycisphaerae bacterium]|nr:hypothetical protein [Phycisphaerae bacterium]